VKKTWVFLLVCLLVAAIANVAFSQENGLVSAINELADRLASANVGYVRSISTDTVYIDLGQASGICEGMRFEVVHLGEPIVSEGVIIGHQEEIIGEIAVTRVREQMSLAGIISKSKEIVEGDKVYQLTKQVERIAITEFPYGERFNNLSKDIEDRFYTAMIQRGMQIVERERLAEILAEQAVEWTGLFDLSSAAELGKLLGVEGVLIGSITDQGETLAIRARLVDVETAQAITAASTTVSKTPAVLDALSSAIRGKPSIIQVQREGQVEQLPAGDFLFSDDFHVQPDERWDITNGKWTAINGQFTPLEKEVGKVYTSDINVSKLRNYVIEVDVYMGRVHDHYHNKQGSCAAFIIGRGSVSDDHDTYLRLDGEDQKLVQALLMSDDIVVDKKGIDAQGCIHVRIEVRGGHHVIFINGKQTSEFFDPLYQEAELTTVGVGSWYLEVVISGKVCTEVLDRTTFDNFRIEEIP